MDEITATAWPAWPGRVVNGCHQEAWWFMAKAMGKGKGKGKDHEQVDNSAGQKPSENADECGGAAGAGDSADRGCGPRKALSIVATFYSWGMLTPPIFASLAVSFEFLMMQRLR